MNEELRRIVEEVAEKMRAVKVQWVKHCGEDDEQDILTYVHGYRDGEPAASVITKIDRDTMLLVVRAVAFAFNAEVVVASFETMNANTENNPITGMPWEPGDMQFYLHEHPELRDEVLTDSLVTVAHDRHKNAVFHSQQYRIKDREVEWLEPIIYDTSEDGQKLAGYVTDSFNESMAGPTLFDIIEEQKVDLFREEGQTDEEWQVHRQFHADMGALKYIGQFMADNVVAVALMAPAGTLRYELIEARMKEMAEQGFEVVGPDGDDMT